MKVRLKPEKEHLVLENKALIRAIISKKFKTYSYMYDDLFSIGLIGLTKAAITYNSEKSTKFSTYACRCIENEIRMFLRKENKHRGVLSLSEPIPENGEISIEDTIADPNSDFYIQIESNDENLERLKTIIEFALNNLEGPSRLVVLYFMSGKKQKWIAEKIGVYQSRVSRVQAKFIKDFKQNYENNQKQYEKKFFRMSVTRKGYQITFSTQEVNTFNKIFATFLRNIDSNKNIPNFEISCKESRISISIFSGIQCLEFIADIIQEMDNYDLSFKTVELNEETTKSEVNWNRTEPKLEPKEECLGKVDDKENAAPVNLTDNMHVNKQKSKSVASRIRGYFMTTDEFTFADVRRAFPDIKTNYIGHCLHQAKNEGLIISTERGKYSVKK